jgi:hypothetical protein
MREPLTLVGLKLVRLPHGSASSSSIADMTDSEHEAEQTETDYDKISMWCPSFVRCCILTLSVRQDKSSAKTSKMDRKC